MIMKSRICVNWIPAKARRKKRSRLGDSKR
jgi:hypothetical protein